MRTGADNDEMKTILASLLLSGAHAGGHLEVDATGNCAAKDIANMALLQEKALRLGGADCESMCKSLGAYPNCQCPGFGGQPADNDATRSCYDSNCQDPSSPCPNDGFTTCVAATTKAASLLKWNAVMAKVDAKLDMLQQASRKGKQQSTTSCNKKEIGAAALLQMKAAELGPICEEMCQRIGAHPTCACPGFDGQPASEGDTRACHTKYCQDPRQPCPNEGFNNCVDASTEVSALQWKSVMGRATQQLDSLMQAVRQHKAVAAPAPAAAAGPAAETGPSYDEKAFKKDWHKEWKQGEVPSWKETYPKAALPHEDSQSDGKISPAR